MKRFLLLCLFFATFLPAIGQRWRPLLPGNLHFFQSPSNYSIRIDSVGAVNGDSTFWLNDIAGPIPSGCPNYYHYFPGLEGFWGDRFVELPGGVFSFISRAGDSLTVHTLDPVGSSWPFATNGSLTATLSSRSVSGFLGILDSVITIDISDGKQFQFSEHHGMIAGVNMGYYLSGGNAMVSALYELPQSPDFRRFYEWQPGDRYGTSKHVGGLSGYYEYHQYTILARQESPAGDSLWLTMQDNSVSIWYPPYDTILAPTDTLTSTMEANQLRHLSLATFEVDADSFDYHWQQPWTLAGFNGRMMIPFKYGPSDGLLDSCGFMPMVMFPDQTQLPVEYQRGLGLTYKKFITATGTSGYHYGTFNMDCYEQAASDSVWPCPGAYILLSAPSPTAMNVGLTPWVDGSRGIQGIRWEGLASGIYELELLDMNGRQLWTSTETLQASGSMELPDGLPQGICLLRLWNQRAGGVAVVKIPVIRN